VVFYRGKRLAKKYYDKLFKEYCIADLSRYKENKVCNFFIVIVYDFVFMCIVNAFRLSALLVGRKTFEEISCRLLVAECMLNHCLEWYK